MVHFADENPESKVKEYRNLAEFTGMTVDEIKDIDLENHEEYLAMFAEYKEWCLKRLNDKCFKFNEEQRLKQQQQIYKNDGGITA